MASAGGREVGRVSIRVVPNTEDFRRKTEQGLRHLRDMKMNIDPEVDKELVKRRAKQAAEDAKQKVPFQPDLDKSSLSGQARLASLWASRFKVRFRAVLDGKLATLQAKELADRLQKIANGTYLKFDRDALSFRSFMDVSGMTAGLDKAIGRMRLFMVHYDEMKRFTKHASIAAVFNGAEKFSARMFRLKGTMKALKEALGDATGAMIASFKPWEAFKHSAKGFVSLGNGLAAFSGILAASLGVFSALTIGLSYVIGGVVDGVKTLSGALLLLPGALMMAGGAVAAARLGFSGFGKAASEALDPTADIEQAVKDLAPAAADSARAIHRMAKPLKDMQKRVQQTTFKGWAKSLDKIGKTYIPVLDRGFNSIAYSNNLIGNSVFAWANQGQTLKSISTGLDLTAESLLNVGWATKPALSGLTELGIAGMESIRDMSKGLPEMAKRFERWALSAKGKQEMRDWIKGGIQGFKDLWSAGSKFAGALKQIGNAFGVAFNRDAIQRLDTTMGKFQDWVGSAEDANSNISKLQQRAENFAGPWVDAFNRIVEALRPALAEIIDFSEKLSGEMADNIAGTVEKMAPLVEKAFKFMNDNSNIFVPLVAGLIGLRAGIGIFRLLKAVAMPFVSAITGTVGAVGKLGKVFKKTGDGAKKGGRSWKFWGNSAKDAGKSVGDVGKKAGKSSSKVGKLFKGVGKGVTKVGKLGSRLIPGLGQVLLVAEGAKLLYDHFEPFNKLVNKGKDKAVNFGKKVGKGFSDGWQNAKEAFSNFDDRVRESGQNAKQTWNDIPKNTREAFDRAGNRIKDKFSGITDSIKGVRDGIVAKAGELDGETVMASVGFPKLEDIKKRASEIKDSVSETYSSLKEKASSAWEGVQESWSESWTGIKDSVSSTWDDLKTKASEAWTGLKEDAGSAWDDVQTRWSDAWTGISSWLTQTWTGIKDGASSAWQSAGERVRGAWDGVSASWSLVWSTVSSTLTTAWEGIKSGASSVFEGVKGTVSGAWDSVRSSTESAWNGLSDTVSSAASSARDAAAGAFSSISDSVSSAWSTVSSVTSSAVSGFVDTVTGGFNEAVGVVAGLPGRFQSALGNVGGLLVSSGRSLVQGFISGIKSMIGAVSSAASSVVSAARKFFPFSPAKKGPFSGRGYTTYSGQALAKDFAGGIRSQVGRVEDAASAAVKAASRPFEELAEEQARRPVLESNARKIAEARKKERDAEADHQKRLEEIRKDGKDSGEKIAEENKKFAEKMAEIRKDLDESLEAPDYSEIDRSFQALYVEGTKQMLRTKLLSLVQSEQLAAKAKAGALRVVEQARGVLGKHPLLADVEMNVRSDHFDWAFTKAIEEAGIHEVPVNFVISNLDQLKSDLGMGDGVISRAIDQAVQWNWNSTDSKNYRDSGKTEVHYHVEDMQEAIRRENLRVRKQMMKSN